MEYDYLNTLLLEGKSIQQISKISNKGVTTIRYWMKKYGLQSKFKSFSEKNNNPKPKCLVCENEINKNSKKYCSLDCQQIFQYNQRLENWISGKSTPSARTFFKKYLTETHGYKCSCCGISEWNKKPIVLEIDHIDGNPENNEPDNLRLICPNCHSQTETYKGKNAGNGRHYRRIRYASGQSY